MTMTDKAISEYKEIMKLMPLVHNGLKNKRINLNMMDGQVVAYVGQNYFFIDDDRGLDNIEIYKKCFSESQLEENICIALYELKDMYVDEYNYYLLCLNN